jgi:hypothetical protein
MLSVFLDFDYENFSVLLTQIDNYALRKNIPLGFVPSSRF